MTPNKKTSRPAAAAGTLAVLLAAPFAFVGSAQAATITVTTGDVSQSTECHLVDAITAANTDTATGGCAAGSGADTIVIPDGITTTLTAVNNGAAGEGNGLPAITSEIRIEAHGNIIERSTAEGTPLFRLLDVRGGGALTVYRAVLRGGSAAGSGGAIRIAALGKLRLDACTVTGNTAGSVGGFGGGISTMSRTVDTADIDVEIRDSLISNNIAPQGGGVFLRAGGTASRILFSNVTVHGNFATTTQVNGGGGLWIFGASTASAVLDHVTVSGNRTGAGSTGAGLAASRISMKNSLICGNSATNFMEIDSADRARFPIISLGGNLAGCAYERAASISADRFTPAASDLLLGNESATSTPIGSILEIGPNKIAILKDNGGPTHTVALVAGSPAINPVRSPTDDLPLRRDQRGYVPNGAATPPDTIRDIGAFEFEGVPPVAPAAPTALAATPGDGSLTIAFTPGAAGTSPITNYAYALGDSTTFTAFDPADGESPVTISGLTNGTALTVRLKAISEDGESAASVSVSGTPNVPGICDLFVVDGVTNVIDLRRAASGQTVRGVSGRFNVIYGSGFADTITGGNAGNCIDAGAGNDRLTAGTGENHLYGGAGNDTLTPGSGSTAMDGGPGTDKCLRASSRASATYASCESF